MENEYLKIFPGRNARLLSSQSFNVPTCWNCRRQQRFVGHFPLDFGCRFVRDSSWFNFTDEVSLLTTFIGTRAPVFVHAKGVPLPTSGDTYLADSTFSDRSNSSTPTLSAASNPLPTSLGDWVLTYSGPASDGSKIHRLHRRPRCLEPVYINYSDFRIYLFYPPSSPSVGGWKHITMRFNNKSGLLESVWFPSLGWIYNLDLNYSMISPDNNPLKVIKRSSNITKLHVYVGPDLIPFLQSLMERRTHK